MDETHIKLYLSHQIRSRELEYSEIMYTELERDVTNLNLPAVIYGKPPVWHHLKKNMTLESILRGPS